MKKIASMTLVLASSLFLASCSGGGSGSGPGGNGAGTGGTQGTADQLGGSTGIAVVKGAIGSSRPEIEAKLQSILKSSVVLAKLEYSNGCKVTDSKLEMVLKRTNDTKTEFTKHLTTASTGDCKDYTDGKLEKPLVTVTKMLSKTDGELCITAITAINNKAEIEDCDGQKYDMDLSTGIVTATMDYSDEESDLSVKINTTITETSVSNEALKQDLKKVNIAYMTSLGQGDSQSDNSKEDLEDVNALEVLGLSL